MPFLLLITADHSALGRVDIASFTDQQLLELLIGDLPDRSKKRYQMKDGSFRDVCKWRAVECDKAHRIKKVSFTDTLQGSVLLDAIPPLVTEFVLRYCKAEGTLDTKFLPGNLKNLSLSSNEFHGPVDMTAFPGSLIEVVIEANSFSGSCDLTTLPSQLVRLNMQHNAFSGSLDLTRLPTSLGGLQIGYNNFSGAVNFEKLPDAMQVLWMYNNLFSETFQLVRIPKAMTMLFAQNNSFEGIAEVGFLRKGVSINLSGNAIASVVDTNGQEHKEEAQILSGRL